MDILIGGATDDVLISSLICGYAIDDTDSSGGGWNYFFPIHIPAGVRLAARLASVRTSFSCHMVVNLYSGGIPPFKCGRKVTTYGTKINNARGQAVTPSQSAAAASVTEMTAATAEDHFAFMPGFQVATDTTISERGYSVGIGVGAATEERIGSWHSRTGAREDMCGNYPPFPCFNDVPAGSRLSLLVSNSGLNDAAYDGLIYAVS